MCDMEKDINYSSSVFPFSNTRGIRVRMLRKNAASFSADSSKYFSCNCICSPPHMECKTVTGKLLSGGYNIDLLTAFRFLIMVRI